MAADVAAGAIVTFAISRTTPRPPAAPVAEQSDAAPGAIRHWSWRDIQSGGMAVSVFVFSDIEGSTELWSTAPDTMREALRVPRNREG